jgi:hypothetical protein
MFSTTVSGENKNNAPIVIPMTASAQVVVAFMKMDPTEARMMISPSIEVTGLAKMFLNVNNIVVVTVIAGFSEVMS